MEILGPPAFPQALDWPREPAGMLWNGGGRSLQARSCFEGLHSHPQPFWCRNFHGVHRPGWSGCLFSSSFLVIDVRIVQLWKFHVDPVLSKWYGFLGIFHDEHHVKTPQQKCANARWKIPWHRWCTSECDHPKRWVPVVTTHRNMFRAWSGVSEGQDWIIKSSKLSKGGSLTQKRLFSRKIFGTFHIRSWDVDTFFWLGGGFKYFFTPT